MIALALFVGIDELMEFFKAALEVGNFSHRLDLEVAVSIFVFLGHDGPRTVVAHAPE